MITQFACLLQIKQSISYGDSWKWYSRLLLASISTVTTLLIFCVDNTIGS